MQQTGNYQLNQWEKADRIQMEDFNGDNSKVDAALKGQAEALAAETAAREALAAVVAKCGNCRVESFTYTGTGAYSGESDTPTVITFPRAPFLYFVIGGSGLLVGSRQTESPVILINTVEGSGISGVSNTWVGNQLRLYALSAAYQMNISGATYRVFALYAQDA